ncbi:MAG TPA: hypothetical protein VGF31_11380, partial [Myxococcaceae bacterium]
MASTALVTGWELLRTAPGAAEAPAAADALGSDWMPAVVPGTLASALRARGMDPLAAGDLDGGDVWYRVRFDRPDDSGRVFLRLEGLATVSEVWLNGTRLLRSESMWQAHRLEVGQLLRSENVLHLRFLALGPLLAERRPRPRWKTSVVAQQQLRWWRTSFLGRIPGWTPPAPAVGPYRPVLLEHGEGPEVLEARVRPRLSGDDGVLELSLRLGPRSGSRAPRVRFAGRERPLEARMLPDGATEWMGRIDVPGVERWWPHTHGAPTLHPLSADVPGTGEIQLPSVGFRTIEADTAGA